MTAPGRCSPGRLAPPAQCLRVVARFVFAACGLVACAPAPEALPPAVAQAPAEQTIEVDLSAFFREMEGTFVVYEPGPALWRVYNPERAVQGYLPASTFKIANSLIALETGAADGPDFALAWDPAATPPAPRWPRSWRQDHVLSTAFQNSVYWFYQELARRIGEEPMRDYLARFDYGNQNMGGGLDRFWLEGDLRISAYEQVTFLERFHSGRLGLSPDTTEWVKEMMLLEEGPAYRLSGKTGTADVTPTRELGWIVGFVEHDDEIAFYALNMEGERVWEDWPPQTRAVLVRLLLADLGILQ